MTKKQDDEYDINPKTFIRDIEGVYNHDPKKTKVNIFDKRDSPPRPPEMPPTKEEQLPRIFDSRGYKEKANQTLQEIGADVKVVDKKSYHLLLTVLIGVIVIFGLFLVWGVANDKFRSDLTCPDCNCPKAELSCPAVQYPDCVCDETFVCPANNNTDIINALNNFSITLNATCGP